MGKYPMKGRKASTWAKVDLVDEIERDLDAGRDPILDVIPAAQPPEVFEFVSADGWRRMAESVIRGPGTFHLKGTQYDHDQQTHAGGGGSYVGYDDPAIRSDGQPFEFENVTALADQYDAAEGFKQAQRFKRDGSRNVTAVMGDEQKQAIADELNGQTVGSLPPGIQGLFQSDSQLRNFGLEEQIDDMPVGLYMQMNTFARKWDMEPQGYEAAEALMAAVTAYQQGGDPADLSAFLADTHGIDVATAAVDWRNRAWQSSAVRPDAVAFHLAATDRWKLGTALRAMNSYYPSGSMDMAYEIRRLMPTTIDTILDADAFAVEDAIQMSVRRDSRSTVTLYRGVKSTGNAATNFEGATAIQPNPLSSWTVDKATARQFAGQYSTAGGWLLTAEVPVSQIVAMSTVNGWGSLQEREVIIRGDQLDLAEVERVGG